MCPLSTSASANHRGWKWTSTLKRDRNYLQSLRLRSPSENSGVGWCQQHGVQVRLEGTRWWDVPRELRASTCRLIPVARPKRSPRRDRRPFSVLENTPYTFYPHSCYPTKQKKTLTGCPKSLVLHRLQTGGRPELRTESCHIPADWEAKSHALITFW